MRIAKPSPRIVLHLAVVAVVAALWSCGNRTAGQAPVSSSDNPKEQTKPDKTTEQVKGSENVADKIAKTDDEWRALLTAEQYRVTRECGTEPPFTGKYYNFKGDGAYLCVACGNELFSSSTKYDSGSGWPSFYAPVSDKKIDERTDKSHGMVRVEVRCSRCGAHLGHVFEDGPAPTGLRYCINSAALTFVGKAGGDAEEDSIAEGDRTAKKDASTGERTGK
jgi:peptide-methionine (R)-S-oxide reductase